MTLYISVIVYLLANCTNSALSWNLKELVLFFYLTPRRKIERLIDGTVCVCVYVSVCVCIVVDTDVCTYSSKSMQLFLFLFLLIS